MQFGHSSQCKYLGCSQYYHLGEIGEFRGFDLVSQGSCKPISCKTNNNISVMFVFRKLIKNYQPKKKEDCE